MNTAEHLPIAENKDGNRPMAEKKSWNRNFDKACGSIFRVCVSNHASRNFTFNRQASNFKKHLYMYRKYPVLI
jgi:hypothetical protein